VLIVPLLVAAIVHGRSPDRVRGNGHGFVRLAAGLLVAASALTALMAFGVLTTWFTLLVLPLLGIGLAGASDLTSTTRTAGGTK